LEGWKVGRLEGWKVGRLGDGIGRYSEEYITKQATSQYYTVTSVLRCHSATRGPWWQNDMLRNTSSTMQYLQFGSVAS
jgi:hypothetical protein